MNPLYKLATATFALYLSGCGLSQNTSKEPLHVDPATLPGLAGILSSSTPLVVKLTNDSPTPISSTPLGATVCYSGDKRNCVYSPLEFPGLKPQESVMLPISSSPGHDAVTLTFHGKCRTIKFKTNL